MRKKVYEIPGKLVVEWSDESKSIFDVWSNYMITVQEFREAILNKGLGYAKANGARAWVMDASKAQGALPQDVKALITTEVFPAFARAGIKRFLTVKSDASSITNMSIRGFSSSLGPNGIELVDVPSSVAAAEWLKTHAA